MEMGGAIGTSLSCGTQMSLHLHMSIDVELHKKMYLHSLLTESHKVREYKYFILAQLILISVDNLFHKAASAMFVVTFQRRLGNAFLSSLKALSSPETYAIVFFPILIGINLILI